MPLQIDRLITTSVDAQSITLNGIPVISGSEDITYLELYNKVVNGLLEIGKWYRLTDYKSVNFLNGWETANSNPTPTDPNFNPQEIYSGETEVLILQATSPYEISEIGYSETFNGDIVQYEPYTNKIGVDIGGISNGSTLPDSSTVSEFDLKWDGTNVYFNMPDGYPALFGHYFYLYAEFSEKVNGIISSIGSPSGIPTLGRINLISSAVGTPPAIEGVFTDITATTNEFGEGATFYVAISSGMIEAIKISSIGQKYAVGDTLLIKGSDIGGIDGVNDLTFEVTLVAGEFEFENVMGISSNGSNATFNVSYEVGIPYYISIVNGGENYQIGDIVTILGSEIGGVDGVTDLTVEITDTTSSVINDYYQDGNFEPLTAGISVCQYPYTSDDVDYGYPKAVSRIKVEDNGMKVILLDLEEQDYLNYDADTLYVDTVYALGDAYGWITRRQDTLRNIDVPFDFRGVKYRRFEVDLSSVNASLGTGYYGIGDDFLGQGTTGNYKDFKSFGNDGYDTFNIKWNDMGGADMFWYRGYNDNNVFFGNFYNNTVGTDFRSNTVGNAFYRSTVGNNFSFNTVGNNFYRSTVGNDFQSNTVGNNFNSNTVGDNFGNNTVGNDFQSNTVGISFNNNIVGNSFNNNTVSNSFFNNTLGSSFYYNIFAEGFAFNTIADNFNNNQIAANFQSNIIGNSFQRNQVNYSPTNTDFSSASYVYANYNCIIFRRADNTLQLSFIAGGNTLGYATINV